jgi:alkylation response protein AidB-like acyl-CoA dehydrogenase
VNAAITAAERIADDVLLPRALATDAALAVPPDSLTELARAGLFGLYGPRAFGGLGLEGAAALAVIERLASGCLTTTFVWMQHHSAVRAVSQASDSLRDSWLGALCRGERRAGVAFAGLRRPGPPVLTGERVDGGYLLDGVAPWVTGWGSVGVVLVAARDQATAGGDIVWSLVDAGTSPTLTVEPLRLMVVNASATVTARFSRHFVDDDRVVGVEPFEQWRVRDEGGIRTNGSLALGVAWRAAHLLGSSELTDRVHACRRRLDSAGPAELPNARAEASELALATATTLVVATGGKAVLESELAQLLAREAVFLLVFGQTAAIKAEQLKARAALQTD